MTDPLSERAARNLRSWAEITELCLANHMAQKLLSPTADLLYK